MNCTYVSNYMTFTKGQFDEDSIKISGCQEKDECENRGYWETKI